MKPPRSPESTIPEPLSGSVIGSFAHSTITRRLPKIAYETINDNDFPLEVNQRFEQLIQEIPFAPIRELNDPHSPDSQIWQNAISPFLGKNWLQIPWFFAEMYFYRRILEALGFHQPGPFQGFDPFWMQKQRVLEAASSSTIQLAALLEESVSENQIGSANWQTYLGQLLVLNVWGNQADLSMWSATESRPDHRKSSDQQSHLLVNDSVQVSEFLTPAGKRRRVDFILDNCGPELIHDIGLADFLLTTNLIGKVRFHAKPTPHYVSDAMIADVHSTIDHLAAHDHYAVRKLASRIGSFIHEQRLEIVDDYFWTSPTYFWDMPEYVKENLRGSDLVISKGDANYRRLAADLNWPPTTPFQEVMDYFPTSLLALRVLKAELALGLSQSQITDLDARDTNWKFNGNWAVIQFFKNQTR